MTQLLVLLVLGLVVLGARHLLSAHRMQQLRTAPPERVAFELRLPKGNREAVDRERLAKVAEASSLSVGRRAWAAGAGQLDHCYIVRRAQGEHTAAVRHVVVVDPAAARQLETTMRNAYGSDLDITRLEHDEGLVLAQAVRATRFE